MVEFKVGDKVEHKLSGSWLSVLKVIGCELECRTKDFKVVTLFDWEVQLIK